MKKYKTSRTPTVKQLRRKLSDIMPIEDILKDVQNQSYYLNQSKILIERLLNQVEPTQMTDKILLEIQQLILLARVRNEEIHS